MRAEIWLGGLKNPAYQIEDVKRIDVSIDGSFIKITDSEGYEWETSPHNVVILSEPNERR